MSNKTIVQDHHVLSRSAFDSSDHVYDLSVGGDIQCVNSIF